MRTKNLYLYRYGPVMLSAFLLSAPVMATTDTMLSVPAGSFQSYDRDGNGMVSPIELREAFLGNIPDDVFQSYDGNNDGTLNKTEFHKFMEKNYEVSLNNQQELMQTRQQNELEQQKAAERAAQLEKQREEELANISKFNSGPKVKLTMDFIVFDKNNDDLVDMEEFRDRTHSIIDPQVVYGAYDENKDGKLNIHEFQRYVNSDPAIPVHLSSK